MIIVPLKTENNLYPRGYKMFKQATRPMILLVPAGTCWYLHVPMKNFPLYLKKAGLASRNIVHLQKIILRCVGFCFSILHIREG